MMLSHGISRIIISIVHKLSNVMKFVFKLTNYLDTVLEMTTTPIILVGYYS